MVHIPTTPAVVLAAVLVVGAGGWAVAGTGSSSGTVRDAKGDTILALTLPLNECYLLVRLETGEIFTSSMAIDTLIVEPDERRAFLVWRAILARDDEVPVRAVEVMQRTHGERDAQRVLIESLKANKGREMARDSQSATSGGLDG